MLRRGNALELLALPTPPEVGQSHEAAVVIRLRQVVAGAQDPTLQKVARQFLSAALLGAAEKASRAGNDAAARPLYEEALEVIKGALKLDPDNAEALNNGAYVLAENLKRPEEALPMSERAVQIMPNAGSFWDTLGLIYLELGRFDEADKKLKAGDLGGYQDAVADARDLMRRAEQALSRSSASSTTAPSTTAPSTTAPPAGATTSAAPGGSG